jgi:hypothetical protein
VASDNIQGLTEIVGLPCTSDRHIAEVATCTTHMKRTRQTSKLPAGLEPAVTTSEWPQTCGLDRTVTGLRYTVNNVYCLEQAVL